MSLFPWWPSPFRSISVTWSQLPAEIDSFQIVASAGQVQFPSLQILVRVNSDPIDQNTIAQSFELLTYCVLAHTHSQSAEFFSYLFEANRSTFRWQFYIHFDSQISVSSYLHWSHTQSNVFGHTYTATTNRAGHSVESLCGEWRSKHRIRGETERLTTASSRLAVNYNYMSLYELNDHKTIYLFFSPELEHFGFFFSFLSLRVYADHDKQQQIEWRQAILSIIYSKISVYFYIVSLCVCIYKYILVFRAMSSVRTESTADFGLYTTALTPFHTHKRLAHKCTGKVSLCQQWSLYNMRRLLLGILKMRLSSCISSSSHIHTRKMKEK